MANKKKNLQIGECGLKSLESPDTGKLLGLLQKTKLYPFISILELGKTSDSHQHVFNFTGWPIIYHTFILQLQERCIKQHVFKPTLELPSLPTLLTQ